MPATHPTTLADNLRLLLAEGNTQIIGLLKELQPYDRSLLFKERLQRMLQLLGRLPTELACRNPEYLEPYPA